MQRREFLRSSCTVCVLGAAGFVLPQLTGCGTTTKLSVYKTSVVNKQIQVPVTMFDANALQIVRPAGWYYDIAVEKSADNTYRALLMQCTHQDNQLTATGTGFSCSLHGSQFDKAGNVRKGPAEDPLTQYKTSISNGQLIIEVPKTP